ncbi:MAG TPA: orotate phosphoribosyltransferase [Thermoleophilia bacterium]|nr:orotate phosphoribosyltransferase [Thermoleophilia bacterium]
MERGRLGELLLETAYLEGDFLLRSGRRSRYYLDKYLFETDPKVLRGIILGLAEMLRERQASGLRYDRLAAPELGAVSLAAALSLEIDLPFLIVRKQSKDYGTANTFEGRWREGEKLAVIEDVVTSGGAVLQAVDRLREAGMDVVDVFCVVDREEGGREAVAEAGLELHALFTSGSLGIGSPPPE